jgi:hypothetical protein
MSGLPDGLEGYPPENPEDEEEVISGSASFLEACRAAWAKDIAKYGWKLGDELVTRNDMWGTIWRADAVKPSEPGSSSLTRLIYCQTPGGKTIYGRSSWNIRPLGEYKQGLKTG